MKTVRHILVDNVFWQRGEWHKGWVQVVSCSEIMSPNLFIYL